MLDVGCPELAPVLERMLSTRNCCASARHCLAPTVPWSICCVTSYLLGGTAITSKTDCISYYPAPVVQKLHARRERLEGYPCLPPGIPSPVLREVREKRRTAWVEEAKGAAKDEGVKADTKADTEASATVPAETVPGTAVRVQAGNAEKNAEKNASRSDRSAGKNAEKNASRSDRSAGRIASGIAGRRSPEEDPGSTLAFARRWVDDAPTGLTRRSMACSSCESGRGSMR
jgi:hypothetical protein